jgi:hypothetical protein
MCSSDLYIPCYPAGAASIPTDCPQPPTARAILDKLIAFSPVVIEQRLLSLKWASNLFRRRRGYGAGANTTLSLRTPGDVLVARDANAL